jgi:hypothetical protein
MTANNSFQRLMTSGTADDDQEPRSLFVSAVLDSVRAVMEREQWVVPQAQVFESGVLFEAKRVAEFETLPSTIEEFVPSAPDGAALNPMGVAASTSFTTSQAAVAAAGLLVSLSRFSTAARVLGGMNGDSTQREQFERLWLEFIISNRCDTGRDSDHVFGRMLDIAEGGDVPDGRVLDICSQGVVWFLKRREISEATVRRLLELGRGLASGSLRADWAGTSAWYRAVAMLPAEKGDSIRTREFMERAEDAAQRAVVSNPSPTNANLVKTYLESSMKEALYVTRDSERFRQYATQLIALDPGWSISYAETAEGFEAFGFLDEARDMWAAAVDKGVPYLWRHTFGLLRACVAVGDWPNAQGALVRLLRDHAPRPTVETAIAKLGAGGQATVPDPVRERFRSLMSAHTVGSARESDELSYRSA